MTNENKKAASNQIEVVILRDVWDAEGNRQRAGATTMMEPKSAMKGAASGLVRLAEDDDTILDD